MRIAVLSDIHSNLRAWNAVLADIGSLKVDRILCLGDLVGYGPSPVEVLKSAYCHVHGFVLGNHDAVVAGKMSPDVFNDRARRLILWTRDRIGPNGARFLGSLPLVLGGNGMRCAHANFARPSAFDYILEPADAAASWAAVPEQLLLVGHTHVPKLFVVGASGTPHVLDPQDFVMEPGKRYIVNVGAVGVPRDTDGRASYVLYDDAAHTVFFRRVPFDMDAFRDDVARAGLDPADVPILRADPRQRLAALREDADFAPPRRAEDEARDVVAEASVETALRRRASRWKAAAVSAIAVAAGIAIGATLLLDRAAPSPLAVPPGSAELKLVHFADNDNVLPPLPAFLEARVPLGDPGFRFGDWGLQFDDRRHQSVVTVADTAEAKDDGAVTLRIAHADGRHTVRIESPFLVVPDDGAPDLTLTALARPAADFSGDYALVLEQFDAEGNSLRKDPIPFSKVPQKDSDWYRAQHSWSKGKRLPKKVAKIRVALTGEFSGTLDVRNVELRRR